MKHKSKTAIIDAEIIIYQVCHDLIMEEKEGVDEYVWRIDVSETTEEFLSRVKSIVHACGAYDFILAFGSQSSWRKRVLPTYKANRAGRKKPYGYFLTIEKIQQIHGINWIRIPTLEGDDILGICATRPGSNIIMVSDDHDLETVPGELYIPRTGTIKTITHEEAVRGHMLQVLAGDSGDGYSGCPGIGKVRAERILDSFAVGGLWSKVVGTYVSAGLTEADALRTARVARVLRHDEYDPSTREVRLWHPKRDRRKEKK